MRAGAYPNGMEQWISPGILFCALPVFAPLIQHRLTLEGPGRCVLDWATPCCAGGTVLRGRGLGVLGPIPHRGDLGDVSRPHFAGSCSSGGPLGLVRLSLGVSGLVYIGCVPLGALGLPLWGCLR